MPTKVKLTTPSYVVLGMVDAMTEATPYDMKRLASISLDYFWSVRHAQLYSEPDRLVSGGYLTVRHEETGRRRKLYKLTAAGSRALAAWLDAPSAGKVELRDEGLLKLFFGSAPLDTAAEQVAIHERNLKAFESTQAEFGNFMTPGQRIALEIGISGEKHWIKSWRKVLESE